MNIEKGTHKRNSFCVFLQPASPSKTKITTQRGAVTPAVVAVVAASPELPNSSRRKARFQANLCSGRRKCQESPVDRPDNCRTSIRAHERSRWKSVTVLGSLSPKSHRERRLPREAQYLPVIIRLHHPRVAAVMTMDQSIHPRFQQRQSVATVVMTTTMITTPLRLPPQPLRLSPFQPMKSTRTSLKLEWR